jgi:hypothetical protein
VQVELAPCHLSDPQIWQDVGNQMRNSFIKNHLPPNGYANCADFFQVLSDFIGRFAQLKAGMR